MFGSYNFYLRLVATGAAPYIYIYIVTKIQFLFTITKVTKYFEDRVLKSFADRMMIVRKFLLRTSENHQHDDINTYH